MLEAEVRQRGDRVFLLLGNFEFEIVVREPATAASTVELLQEQLAVPHSVLQLLAEAQVIVEDWRGLKAADSAAVKAGWTQPLPGLPAGPDAIADRVTKEISDVLAQAQSPTSGSTSSPTSA